MTLCPTAPFREGVRKASAGKVPSLGRTSARKLKAGIFTCTSRWPAPRSRLYHCQLVAHTLKMWKNAENVLVPLQPPWLSVVNC